MTNPASATTLLAALVTIAALAAVVAGCSERKATTPAPPVEVATSIVATPWTACQASDQAWVRRATLALRGRRNMGQGEVNAFEDVLGAVSTPGGTAGHRVLAGALMTGDDFRLRWSDFFADALRVARIEDQSQDTCYGSPSASAVDDGSLAAWLRDHEATDSTPPIAGFTMHELLSSALELDDISVVYRAHLFAMMSRPLYSANLDVVAMEDARREDFGGVFDGAYIHRNLTCLQCHNSQFSVTANSDPTLNRAWPVPGLFEQALFGSSDGTHPVAEAATKGSDFLRAHSMLRFDGVGNAPDATSPYGWSSPACGAFGRPTGDPLLDVDTYFGAIRGENASVWDLEASLERGVDKLANHGLTVLAGGVLPDADEAFAYLVAENIVEQVWAEVMGTGLTIANYFPRNSIERDTLVDLTTNFTANHFSLKKLLLEIVTHPAFNLQPPSEGCGVGPYDLPNLFDPWTISSSDVSMWGNGVGDGVFAVSSRPLVRSLNRALGWPVAEEYPLDPTFETAVGFFLKDATPGTRGFDFQGRLTWESTYGACAPQSGPDFVSEIVEMAATVPGATVEDGVIALKNRLLGEPNVEPAVERPVLEALVGRKLDSPALLGLDGDLRRVCGVFVSSPQLLLGGTVPADTRTVPKLTPNEASYLAACQSLRAPMALQHYTVTCRQDSLSVTDRSRAL